MSIYNNGYPASYQNPYQQQYQQQMQQYQQQQQVMMTPPTIHAEIVQVDGEQAASAYPVGAGMSQMMIARDDSAIYIKSATANGATLDVYVRRPPEPPAPKFDPAEYVRRDELAAILAELRKEPEHEPV